MKAPNKIRDSQKLIHFLRTKLPAYAQPVISFNYKHEARPNFHSRKTEHSSVNESTHFSDISLKNKCNKYDNQLVDVEDLDKVYGLVRENLNVPRPKIILEQKESGKEFEDKIFNDPVYREKIMKQQREQAKKLRESKRAKENMKRSLEKSRTTAIEDDTPSEMSKSTFKENIDELEAEAEREATLSLEALQIRKRVGQYNVEISRHTGRKISYQIYAFVEMPKSKQKQGVQEIEEDAYEKAKENFEYIKKEKVVLPEDENPYVKVLIKDHDPFKREAPYVPLKNEEIDLKTRMERRWNPPDWMKFSGMNMRKTNGRSSVSQSRVIVESEYKLKATKANNSFTDYKDESFLQDIQNLSTISDCRNLVAEREYEISLKHPTLLPQKVKLQTLSEKVDDRDQFFKRLREEEKSKRRDIKQEVMQKLQAYKKNGGKMNMNKSSQMMEKSSQSNKNSATKPPMRHRQTIYMRDSQKASKNNMSGSSDGFSPKESIKAGVSGDFSQHFEKDNTGFDTFITQNQELPGLVKGMSTPPKEYLDMSIDLSAAKSTEPLKRKITGYYGKTRPPHKPSNFQSTGRQSTGSQSKRKSVLSTLSSFTGEFTETDRQENPAEKAAVTVPKDQSLKTDTVMFERKAKSVPRACEEIEQRFNQTFSEFAKVKKEADTKFRKAIDILKKDRPMLNKIRFNTYKVQKMLSNRISNLRTEAENERVGRFEKNGDQRALYFELLEFIVSKELQESKLAACYYFMNVFKEILERGDRVCLNALNQVLNKIDAEGLISPLFIEVLAKATRKLEIDANGIQHESIRNQVVQFIRAAEAKKQTKFRIPSTEIHDIM